MKYSERLGTLLLLAAGVLAGYRPAPAQAVPVRERLGAEPQDSLHRLLARVYERRHYRPGWVSDRGPSSLAAGLLAVIEAAGAHGLDPNDYPHREIRALLGQTAAPDTLARLELLLSRTLLVYGADLSGGRIEPAAVNSPWTAAARQVDLSAALEQALDSGGPGRVMERLAPPQPPYARLRGALHRYRQVATRGGWPAVPAGPELTPGTRDVRVVVLRARLLADGDLASDEDSGGVYDAAMAQAVRRFQDRHGITPDGVVGAATRAALNVPVEARIRQIELNMERWRWLPRSLGPRYIMVNTAAFTLAIVEGDRQVGVMRAIVGRGDWPTPIVSGHIRSIVFSPVWNIPRSIAVEEVLPLIRRDPHYLERHRIGAYADSSRAAAPVDPATVDWAAMNEVTFDLRLRQAPGGDNPLGGAKACIGSLFNVCIHDTPARTLFGERVRTFSHGCVRVDRAADLATYLLQDSARWTGDSVRSRMMAATESAVRLSQAIPAHLSYWTAWVEDDGRVAFRDDGYGWDAMLDDALVRRRADSASHPAPAPRRQRAAGTPSCT